MPMWQQNTQIWKLKATWCKVLLICSWCACDWQISRILWFAKSSKGEFGYTFCTSCCGKFTAPNSPWLSLLITLYYDCFTMVATMLLQFVWTIQACTIGMRKYYGTWIDRRFETPTANTSRATALVTIVISTCYNTKKHYVQYSWTKLYNAPRNHTLTQASHFVVHRN